MRWKNVARCPNGNGKPDSMSQCGNFLLAEPSNQANEMMTPCQPSASNSRTSIGRASSPQLLKAMVRGRRCSGVSQGSTHSMRRTENRLTRISIGIVSLFLVCHVWRLIPTLYEAIFSEDLVLDEWPYWLIHIYHLSHTLIVFNSAVNFLVYVVG